MFTGKHTLLFLAAILVSSTVMTEITRLIALRLGFISKPVASRWNQRVVALGGGVALNLALLLGILAWVGMGESNPFWIAVCWVFLLGLVDDIWGVTPSVKLIIQTIAAAFIVSQGYVLPLPWPVVGIAVSIVWIVGVTNAVNLVDNMDGLAAGITTVAALGFSVLFFQSGDNLHAGISMALGMAAAGFLIHNFYPARIFMGDSGSLPIGFALAALATKIRFVSELSPAFSILPALLILIVPLFDTVLVIVARRNAHRPVMSGGRDHTSHRLVALGLSEVRAVMLLYVLGVLGIVGAVLMQTATPLLLLSLSVGGAIGVLLFGIFLLEIAVYPALSPDEIGIREIHRGLFKGHNALPLTALYLIELAVDICVICAAWAGAHLLRFSDLEMVSYQPISVIPLLPFIIAAKLIAFSAFRLYRGLWRTIVAQDVYRIFKAVSLGTLIFIAGASLVTRLMDVSRIVIVLDWMLTFLGMLGARASITAFRRWSRRLSTTPYRAAFVGASVLGPAVREAVANERGIEFSGVIATDKTRLESMDGILGAQSDLEKIVADREIDILIVERDSTDPKVSFLASTGVIVRQIRVQLD